MIVSIEPGYYEPNAFGIRLENLYLISELQCDGSSHLQFEPLTWIPFQKSLINISSLSAAQLRWLNEYHSDVKTKLSPMMKCPADVNWLERSCAMIS